MSAEAIATELFSVVLNKLTDEAFKRIARAQGIHTELKDLKNTLSRIQDLLFDASQKEVTDKTVQHWLNDLRHLVYDIDDVLDDVATESMQCELTQDSSGATTSMVRKFIPTCCNNFSLGHRLSPKLDSITIRLQRLEKQNPGLTVKGEKSKNTSTRNETSLLESYVVGRQVDKEKLLNMLLSDEPSEENFSIVPIVGMAGVGKTTLARLLYNDTKVQSHFESKAWVCISDDFDIFKISSTILNSVTKENKEFKDLDTLQVALRDQIKGKRFLLVVDDVWNEDYEDWEKLVRPLLSCALGSRIIMTTRKEQLLKKLGFDHLDSVKSLSPEDAISLFAFHALGVDNFDSHTPLKTLGEGIVKKCDGLPLALKAIGRLLRTRIDGEYWKDVLNSEIWNLENSVVPALMLSYHDLSADLKRLFAYCSLFPKDFLFDKNELVLLWMAEGFLNPTNIETKSPERLGHEYFDILFSRSFFQHAPNNELLFIMHDLMNDLATFVGGEFFLWFKNENHTKTWEEDLAKHRHISFTRKTYVGYHRFEAFKRATNLRTLLAVSVGVEYIRANFYLSYKILDELLPKLPLLRVLSLSHFHISEVPECVGTLKHLRYLNVSHTNIKKLPENIGNLYNLKTLIVFSCKKLTILPKSFLKLKNLRHFDIRDTPLLIKLPLGIGELESLHTLSKIIIGGDDDFAINELKGLKNLHGKISIEGLHKVQSATHAQQANLSSKRITELELEWVDVFDGSQRGTLENEVLSELKPHSNTLESIHIKYFGGIKFPDWIADPLLLKLVHVSISGCRKCTSLPSLGQLPSLKKLFIEDMDEVKDIGLELTGIGGVGFPKLEILSIINMKGWEKWSINSQVAYPRLQEFNIKNCSKLIDISIEAVLPSLRVLEVSECGYGVLKSIVWASLSISRLTIYSVLGLTDEPWRGVTKYLGAVEEVSIGNCNEIRYLWESEKEASKVFVKLKKLHVQSCNNMRSLGEKEEVEGDNFGSNLLSSLRMLEVDRCDNMERVCCPNSIGIDSLSIFGCQSLTRVSFPTTAATGGGGGRKLKSLDIRNCNKLIENINNASMRKLERVETNNEAILNSVLQLGNYTHLTSLSIWCLSNIESFPDISLPNLTDLSISYCENLKSVFHLSKFIHLAKLEITDCTCIESFPDISLPNLTDLSIEKCTNLRSVFHLSKFIHLATLWIYDCPCIESFPNLSNLTMLNKMEIINCQSMDVSFPGVVWPPKLVSVGIGGLKKPISEWGAHTFPTSLVRLGLFNEAHVRDFHQLSSILPSSLTRLEIFGFENLESLSMGLQHLTSLQHLEIWVCPKMKHLPQVLLPSLLSLRINGCRDLEERCNGRGSHYWPLISHIPCIQIDHRYI